MKKVDFVRLGAMIRADRGALTQEEYAPVIGLAQGKVSRLESGDGYRRLPEEVAQAVRKRLGDLPRREPLAEASRPSPVTRHSVDTARANIAALPYLPDEIKRGLDAHLAGQVHLLTTMAVKIDDLIRLVMELRSARQPSQEEITREIRALEGTPTVPPLENTAVVPFPRPAKKRPPGEKRARDLR